MIPDSITDGRKRIMATIVCFAGVFTNKPMIHPMARVTQSRTTREQKYSGRFVGNAALNTNGATAKTIRQTISVCMNEEMNCVITPPNFIVSEALFFVYSFVTYV